MFVSNSGHGQGRDAKSYLPARYIKMCRLHHVFSFMVGYFAETFLHDCSCFRSRPLDVGLV